MEEGLWSASIKNSNKVTIIGTKYMKCRVQENIRRKAVGAFRKTVQSPVLVSPILLPYSVESLSRRI